MTWRKIKWERNVELGRGMLRFLTAWSGKAFLRGSLHHLMMQLLNKILKLLLLQRKELRLTERMNLLKDSQPVRVHAGFESRPP